VLAGERGDADAARIGGVEAFDEGARAFCDLGTWLTALEEGFEAHVAVPFREASELVEKRECLVAFFTSRELAVAKACIDAAGMLKVCVGVAEQVEQFGRATVDELRAQLDGEIHFAGMEGEDASADAVAGFEHCDPPTGRCERIGSGEAGDACADDEHVDVHADVHAGMGQVLRAFQCGAIQSDFSMWQKVPRVA
jgi:hypothetical protein